MKAQHHREPDCCHNVLVIGGEGNALQDLIKVLFPLDYLNLGWIPKACVFDFNRVLPIPRAEQDKGVVGRLLNPILFPIKNTCEAIGSDLMDEDRWCIEHWGTRYNANHAQVTLAPTALLIYFTTLWSPPERIYQQLKWQYPSLKMTTWSTNIKTVTD